MTSKFLKNLPNKILFGGGVLFDLTKWFIILLVLIALLNKFWITIYIVDGASMEPTLHDKEIVFLQRNAYNSKEPKRGDIVTMNYPGDPEHKKYVKRIVALPGEKIEISNSKVLINGQVQDEEYLPIDVITEPNKSWQLKSGEYFLMGDNRMNSNDCRFFGPVEKRFITGKSSLVLFPRFLQQVY